MGKGQRPSSFRFEIGHLFCDNTRHIEIIDRKFEYKQQKAHGCQNGYTTRCKKYYKIHCYICGYEGFLEQYNLINRGSCPCCSGKVVCEGINDIATTDPEFIKYFKNENDSKIHTRQSNKRVVFVCPDCKSERDILISNVISNGYSCIHCGDGISYPNKFIYSILKQLKIHSIIREFSEDWCEPHRYDFYFANNDNKYLLEADGMFHYKEFNLNRNLESIQEADNKKDILAIENGYILIRIDCRFSEMEYIKNNILKSKLYEIFDLTYIDWEECERFARKSIIKDVCDIYNDNYGQITTYKLAQMFDVNPTTILNYLKIGTGLGMCEYKSVKEKVLPKVDIMMNSLPINKNFTITDISKETGFDISTVNRYIEIAKTNEHPDLYKLDRLKKRNANPKNVGVYNKNGDLIKVYETASIAADIGSKDFGVKLRYAGVYRCCMGETAHHKDLIFRYIN